MGVMPRNVSHVVKGDNRFLCYIAASGVISTSSDQVISGVKIRGMDEFHHFLGQIHFGHFIGTQVIC